MRGAEVGTSSAVVIPLKAHRNPTAPQPGSGAGKLDIVPADVVPRHLVRPNTPWLSAAVALGLHASVLGALWFGLSTNEPRGGGGQYLEAISVTLVPSQVLEAPDTKTDALKGGAVTNIAPPESVREPQERRSESQTPQAEKYRTQVQQIWPKPEQTQPANDNLPQHDATALPAGGSTARVLTESPQVAATAGASPGEISRYAMAVRAALARSKPRGAHQKGTVTITFGIGPSGEVRFARVTERTGRATLGETTVAAVQRTSFPPPPAAMNAEQLTYVVPFRFK